MTAIKLTRPMILFGLIRALAVAVAVAIAFGLNLPYADWMPVAALVAMQTSLQQSTLVATQRVIGAILGAAIAIAFLLGVDNRHVLEVVILLLGLLAGAIRSVNYAWYCTAVAAAVLIALDIAHPTNIANEGRRILFTLIGVGIAVLVMALASLLQKRSAGRAA